MKNYIKNLFKCEHEWEFVRNIYGDEINTCGGYRSVWKCSKCGKLEYKKIPNLPLGQELNNIYNEYYANEYKNWQEKRAETLVNIKNQMLKDASEGRCWSHFIIFCEEKYNDKNYFEQWLRENKIKINDISIHEQNGKKYPEINSYMFKVSWS